MKLFSALAIAAAALLLLPALPEANAATCAMIRGTGIGATEGIAHFMATKAVTDSAAKYSGKHTLSPVKVTCSGFSCQGAAKACKK